VAISRNLRDWQKGGISYEAPASFWGKADFWAPDLYYYEGKYYMFATLCPFMAKYNPRIFILINEKCGI